MPSARPIRYINAVMASVIDGIITADETGVIVSFNPAAERIFGYSADKILGKHVLTLLSEPFRSEQARDLRDYLRGGESTIIGVNREVIGLRKDRTVFPMDLAVSEVRLEGARVFVGAVRDITKRKRAEEALQRSEERFELAVRGSRDGLWDWDIVSDEVYYAPQYMALLGFSENEYPGFADSFRSHLHPEDRERVFSAFMAHLKERRPFDEEFRHRCKDGSIRYFRARGQAVWSEEGKATRMAGSITDITAHKEAERQLAEALHAAESANQAKSQFLTNMSHELRTPLNSVIGFSNLMHKNKAGHLTQEDLRYLERIRENGIHLLSLINEILDISKIEAGRTELEITPVVLKTLVEEAVSGIEAAALEKNLRLHVDVPDGLEPIPADEKRLKQVLINLLGNAVKFTEEGTISVRLYVAPGTARADRIDVTDTGIGIPRKQIPGIFESFQQADASTTRKYGGTGLGLAISRSLCRLMGFDLTAESEIDHGPTFTILLGSAETSLKDEQQHIGVADGPRTRH